MHVCCVQSVLVGIYKNKAHVAPPKMCSCLFCQATFYIHKRKIGLMHLKLHVMHVLLAMCRSAEVPWCFFVQYCFRFHLFRDGSTVPVVPFLRHIAPTHLSGGVKCKRISRNATFWWICGLSWYAIKNCEVISGSHITALSTLMPC